LCDILDPGDEEIIVVDNSDTAGIGDFFTKWSGDVTILRPKVNLGFSRACNLAASNARGRFLLLLNPDAMLSRRTCDALSAFLAHHPGAAGVSPVLVNPSCEVESSGERFPTALSLLRESLAIVLRRMGRNGRRRQPAAASQEGVHAKEDKSTHPIAESTVKRPGQAGKESEVKSSGQAGEGREVERLVQSVAGFEPERSGQTGTGFEPERSGRTVAETMVDRAVKEGVVEGITSRTSPPYPCDGCEVDWVRGACVLLRRDAWDEAGGFDPAYFLYGEDKDLCYRFRQKGWKVYCLRDISVLHLRDRSGRRNPESLLHFHRSQHHFFRKFHSFPLQLWAMGVYFCQIVILSCTAAVLLLLRREEGKVRWQRCGKVLRWYFTLPVRAFNSAERQR
jgi:GT2 family glycosyltransferase